MMPNLMPARDREASVARVDVPLSAEDLRRCFLGREAYRRTRYIIALRADDAAVLRIEKQSEEPLFSPIVEVDLVAEPEETARVRDPGTDTTNPTQMARAARALAPFARCTVVHGRYEHVSFILDPSPIQIRVLDVVPPEPPKLYSQIQQVLGVSEDLPPIDLQLELIDLRELARSEAADRYLFPCLGGGAVPDGAPVDYLDQRPPHAHWTLVGCARSRDIYRWFYHEEPTAVEMCPRARIGQPPLPTLTKCCLLEREISQEGTAAVVPWGASLDEVRRGLERLLSAIESPWSAA